MLAAVVVVTLPMVILEASISQTVYVVVVWLFCIVSFALSFLSRSTPQAAAWFASSLGLAVLTKGTAYIFAAPMVLALGYWMLTRLRHRMVWPAVLMLVIPLTIKSGYFVRNQTLFPNPLAPSTDNSL